MPLKTFQESRMDQVYDAYIKAVTSEWEIEKNKFEILDIDLCLIMKHMLVKDFKKIVAREDFYKTPNPLNDLTDDHFELNQLKSFRMTIGQLVRRDVNYNSVLNFLNKKKIEHIICEKQNTGLSVHEGPVKSDNYFLMSSIKTLEKSKPFALIHLSAVEVMKQFHELTLKSLIQIYIILRHRNFAVRVGKEIERNIFHIYSIIKQYIHKDLSQAFLHDAYFDNIKLNPSPFCLWCNTKFNEKIYAKTTHGFLDMRYDCACRLCKFLRLGVSKTTVVEINGHSIDCPNQDGLSD